MAAKTFDYIIVLKKRSYVWIDRISQLMLLFAFIRIGIPVFTQFSPAAYLPIAILVLMAAWWAYCLFLQHKGKPFFFRLAFLFAAWGIIIQPQYQWMAFIYILAAVLEKQIKFPQEVAFDATEVVINTFPRKKFVWDNFSNIVLKDGMLTLDFRNNQLFQKEIESAVAPTAEAEFNEFCRTHLTNNNEKP